VDQCEDEPDRADAINGHAVGVLAQISREFGTRLVHISTDAVFSGTRDTPYSPDDPPGPISAYGRSKLLGEQLLRQVNPPGWLIVRTAWLFGDGHCFSRIIADRAKAGQPLRVVNDQVGSPTYADDLAAAMIDLVKRNAQGVWHVTNGGRASWFDVARATLDELSMDVALEPISTAEYRAIRPRQAPRLAYSVLDCSAFTRTVGRSIRDWRAALREYCERFLTGEHPASS
jgi:dTDP-4-dehydrorhamnose reductase